MNDTSQDPKSWLAVASAEHVRRGLAEGFMQVNHGKLSPLRRIQPGDRIAYYSPSTVMMGKDRLQSFTAIGVVSAGEPYQVTMSEDFSPFRRNVDWFAAHETPIQPLLPELELTAGNPNWGYQLRRGLLPLTEHDMDLIAQAMGVYVTSSST